MSIRPLPRHVAEQIKSSVLITSLNDAVSGLVKNALDAEASTINIYLDYVRGGCTVEDNGVGIPPSEFRADGGLGKAHHTSKLDYPAECHGSNGDFLAAVAALSLLSITSHHQEHHSHNSLSVHHSAVVSRNTPSLPEQRLLTFSHGTRASVRDLFGSIPVRAKQRPASGDRGAIEKEWRRLLRDVVGLMLPWRNPVSVYMREANAGLEIRLRPPMQKPGSAPGPQDLLSRVSRTLIQANLADAEDAGSWERVGGSGAGMSVAGCVSVNPVATRRSQFICLGVQPIPNDAGSNVLYEEVNRMFASSAFALEDEDETAQRSRGGIWGQKPRRGVERWPMFYFRVDVRDRAEGGRYGLDQFLDQRHRVEAVADLLKAVCYEFLRKHHFKPQPGQTSVDRRQLRGSREGTPSRLSTAPTRSKKGSSGLASPFDMWSRVKAGKPVYAGKSDSRPTPQVASPAGIGEDREDGGRQKTAPRQPLVSREGKLLRAPFPDAEDPTEGNTAKTQLTEKGHCGASRPGSTPAKASRNQKLQAESPTDTVPDPSQQSGPSQWVADLVHNWKNPTFAPVQPSIPKFTCGEALPETPSVTLQSHISRSALREAEVISQVDGKFVLARLPQPSGPLLVLIDQHAADERCRLEELARGYFSSGGRAESEPLAEPLRFEVPSREGALLLRSRAYFARWGVSYSAAGPEVTVFALPPSILERCRQEPGLLIRLLRAEAWKLEERGGGMEEEEEEEAGVAGEDWVRRLHGCPRGILDLLNSRACRSAVMFNDPLTKEECEALVARLSATSFPFTCAHGRPSMVPLLDLGRGAARRISGPVSFKSWLDKKTG